MPSRAGAHGALHWTAGSSIASDGLACHSQGGDRRACGCSAVLKDATRAMRIASVTILDTVECTNFPAIDFSYLST